MFEHARPPLTRRRGAEAEPCKTGHSSHRVTTGYDHRGSSRVAGPGTPAPICEIVSIDDLFDDGPWYPSKGEPSRRWVRRSVVIGCWIAFAVTCLTACFAVTVVVVGLGHTVDRLDTLIRIAIAVAAILVVAIYWSLLRLSLYSPLESVIIALGLLQLRALVWSDVNCASSSAVALRVPSRDAKRRDLARAKRGVQVARQISQLQTQHLN